MKTAFATAITAIMLNGCSMPTRTGMNWVEPRHVQMETSSPTYRQDLLHCREIAEKRDYFTPFTNKALGDAIAAGVAGGIVGGLAGVTSGMLDLEQQLEEQLRLATAPCVPTPISRKPLQLFGRAAWHLKATPSTV